MAADKPCDLEAMARDLRAMPIDLDNERAVFLALIKAGYRAGDVLAMCDAAIAEAHRQNKKSGVLPRA